MAEQRILTAEEMAKTMREVSVAEFFEKNRHLLGYENTTKALITIVKELVDNSLDAADEAGILPDIKVSIKEVTPDRFRISCEDNGPGIVAEKVPLAFGSLLYGSKFHRLRQSRGTQGIGVSGAILYSQLTTGKHSKILSSTGKMIHEFELGIDVAKNQPHIFSHKEQKNPDNWHGIRIEMEGEGRYIEGRQSVAEYLKQTAIVNPHAKIVYDGPNGKTTFDRALKEVPKQPREIKPHPYGIEVGILRRMASNTKARNIVGFMTSEFSRVGKGSAEQICKLAKIEFSRKPNSLSPEESERLHKAMQMVKLIAPPTDVLSPMGEHVIKEGLKKELKAEFFIAITRPPTVYRGNPFQVECVTGDTEIILENGQKVPIKDFVEKNIIDKKVFCMDRNLKIRPMKVLAVHRIPLKHKLYKLKTHTGREIKITHNNEIPIINNGKIHWKPVEQVNLGDFIATPRQIQISGKRPGLLNLLDDKTIKIYDSDVVKAITDKLQIKFDNLKITADKLGINYERLKSFRRNKSIGRPTLFELKRMCELVKVSHDSLNITKISIVDNKFPNPVPIKISKFITEDLLYLLGLIQSDGYLFKKSWQIGFVNKERELLNTFKKMMLKNFGIVCTKNKDSYYINNKTAFILVQKIAERLTTLDDKLITAWLKGISDGDGWVAIRKDGSLHGIGIATAKREESRLVQYLLLRLGILSAVVEQKSGNVSYIQDRKIITKKKKHYIEIRDFENIARFANIISFRQKERRSKLNFILSREIEERSSSDIIPVGGLLSEIRNNIGLKQYDFHLSDQSIRSIEKGRQNITRKNLQKIANKLNISNYQEEITNLAFSDILFDKTVKIKKINKNEKYVYDLTTEAGNFVANNIVIHNCGLAYGGELPEQQTAELFRFANKVPLLYHQSDCATASAVTGVNWRSYGLSQSGGGLPQGPLTILIHFASVWVPFTSEGKQAIAEYPEIVKEIKLALQDAGRKLSHFVNQRKRAQAVAMRRQIFERYMPIVAESLAKITGKEEKSILKKFEDVIKKKTLMAEMDVKGEDEAEVGNEKNQEVIGESKVEIKEAEKEKERVEEEEE
jgi:DNA topoisomerase VI B subunit